MEIRWNAGIVPAQIGQEVTTTGITSVANGVSQATPAGISAAKDAFEKTTILGQVSGQSIHGGIAAAAQHLSPTAYLKGLPLIGNRPESMVQIGTLSGGMGDHKVMEGISQKLTREKLDSASNHKDVSGVHDTSGKMVKINSPVSEEERLKQMFDQIKNMVDSMNDIQKNAISVMK